MTADAVTSGAGGAVRTTCPYCGVGCGVLPVLGATAASRYPAIPTTRPISAGSAPRARRSGETLSLDDRLLTPTIGGSGRLESALGLVARTFSRTIAEHGPDSVAFYVSGQLLTEDYYVANKLMKGFIGSANIDTNSRLCMASTVAGHRRAFGSDTVPGTYEDLELADLVVLVGSNLAWCHPVLYQRLVAAKEERGTKVVVIDPRRTATAEIADLHLALAPGSDIALFNGLLDHLDRAGVIDATYVNAHTAGFADALATARATGRRRRHRPDCPPRRCRASTRCWPRTGRSCTVFRKGSTSPQSAPTRSTPSSTATWQLGGSGSPAWGRSR